MRYRIIIGEKIIIDGCPVQLREDLIPLNAASDSLARLARPA
jgi:hypothetical protein